MRDVERTQENNMWYKVTYEAVPSHSVATDLVYATRYHTQATSSGMVADFYTSVSKDAEKLTDTFNKVVKVQSSLPCDTVRLDISLEDASYINRVLFRAEPEGSDAIRALIKKATEASWTYEPFSAQKIKPVVLED